MRKARCYTMPLYIHWQVHIVETASASPTNKRMRTCKPSPHQQGLAIGTASLETAEARRFTTSGKWYGSMRYAAAMQQAHRMYENRAGGKSNGH
jgi:hypothetical protein